MRKPLSGTAASPRVRVACHRVRGRSQTARGGLIFIGTALVQSELALEVATRAGTIIAQFTWTRSEKMAKRRQQTRRGVQARKQGPRGIQQKVGQTFSKAAAARSSNYGVRAWRWFRMLPIDHPARSRALWV